jgi:serine protease Do
MTRRLLNAGLALALTCFLTGTSARADGVADNAQSVRMTPTVRAIQRVAPSTVNIHSEKRARSGDPLHPTGKKVNGMGTGIIVDERGYIVTNYHVVQDVELLQVTLQDNTTYSARVVSFDTKEDLAVIKISAPQDLPVMPMGTSSDLMIGEDVLAVGNAFGYAHTVTRGIVSAMGRDVEVNDEQAYRNLVQIDAAINPGNSGGPLINMNGDVIAINVAIRAGAQKIGFAIPIDDARRVIARMLDVERLSNLAHGLSAHDYKQGADRKLVVDGTEPNSPAANAGLQPGDVVVKTGTVTVVDAADFERALLGKAAGEVIPVTVVRNGTQTELSLRIDNSRAVAGRQKVQTAMTVSSTVTPAPPTATGDRTWDMLGLKLNPLPSGNPIFENQSYRGGMIVADVRSGSPAAQNGIRNGDVLVGLHVWETVTQENVDYVLKSPTLKSFSPLKFYILREKETLYGHFAVAAK